MRDAYSRRGALGNSPESGSPLPAAESPCHNRLMRGDGGAYRHQSRLLALAHPAFTGAVALLAINDHLLKSHFPSWITGKLSDFAGIFVVAVLFGLLMRRPYLASFFTGLGFTAIKLSGLAAVLVAPILGGVTRQDPSDLLALVFLWPAALFLRKSLGHGADRPRVRPLLLGASAIATLLALTATSCLSAPVLEAFTIDDNGRVFARIRGEPEGYVGETRTLRWAVSEDAGLTWQPSSRPPGVEATVRREVCDERRCFRLLDGSRVQERSGHGPWRTSFAFSSEEARRLNLRLSCSSGVLSAVDMRSLMLVPQGEEATVLVAMGAQGVLRRTSGGGWERRAVLDLEPLPLHGPSWLAALRFSPLLLGALTLVVLVLAASRSGWQRGLLVLLVGGVGAVSLLLLAGILSFLGVDYVLAGPPVAILSAGAFVATLVLSLRDRSKRLTDFVPGRGEEDDGS